MPRVRFYPWYGGKLRVVHELSFLIPEHEKYVEPFMGSAAMFLNHPRSEVEVLNDLDTDLVCLMSVMADREKGRELTNRLGRLSYGKERFKKAECYKKHQYQGLSDIERAVEIYVLITQSFNATRRGFADKRYKSSWDYQKLNRFYAEKVYERMQGVRIRNEDGINVLKEIVNDDEVFALVDPPYRTSLRGKNAGKVYEYELSEEEQIRLLETIQEAKAKILLCGYREEGKKDLYDEYLLSYGWRCYKLKDLPKSSQNKSKRDVGQEFIWVNYELPPIAKYVISMQEYRSI